MTYGELLEGTPNAEANDRLLQRALARARGESDIPGRAAFLIPPARRDFFREPGDMTQVKRHYCIPEWMPVITCVGMFESVSPVRKKDMHGSCLPIIWLQDEYAPPISAAALEFIKSIDWASLAFDFQF